MSDLLRAVVPAACLAAASLSAVALAHAPAAPTEVREAPAGIAVTATLPPAPKGITELRFRDLIRHPVGPRGLEASDALRALDGRHVRIVGFMVQQATPVPGRFLLSPLPAAIGDDDEGLADDVPPALLEVVLATPAATVVHMTGLLQISGTLELGPHEAPGNPRIAFARIHPDAPTAKALAEAAPAAKAP